MRIIIYPLILEKLRVKHGVSADEVEQTFLNRTGPSAGETRPQNQGTEDHRWFVSIADVGRELKVVFFIDTDENAPVVITAYEPNDDEVIYMKKSNRKKRSKEQNLLAEAEEWESGKRVPQSTAATDEDEAALNEAMELQMISIRLPQSVVEGLKALAKKEGIGYQPYTRQVLIHHIQGDDGSGKIHDLEKRLKSVERAVFKKTAGR